MLVQLAVLEEHKRTRSVLARKGTVHNGLKVVSAPARVAVVVLMPMRTTRKAPTDVGVERPKAEPNPNPLPGKAREVAREEAKVVVGQPRPGARAKANVVAQLLVVVRAVARVLARALAAPLPVESRRGEVSHAESPSLVRCLLEASRKEEAKDRREELLPRGRHIAAPLPPVIVIAPFVMRY